MTREVEKWACEQAIAAADWWTAKIREQVDGKPMDNGDARSSQGANAILAAARSMPADWSEQHFRQFREILALSVDDFVRANVRLTLAVDYGPSPELAHAALGAGFVCTHPGAGTELFPKEYISTWAEPHTISSAPASRRGQYDVLHDLFPWKTNMIVTPGERTMVSDGYAAPWELVWGTPAPPPEPDPDAELNNAIGHGEQGIM